MCACVLTCVSLCSSMTDTLCRALRIGLPWRERCATFLGKTWQNPGTKQGTGHCRPSREFISAQHTINISLWEKQHQCLPGNLWPWMPTTNGTESTPGFCSNTSELLCFKEFEVCVLSFNILEPTLFDRSDKLCHLFGTEKIYPSAKQATRSSLSYT